MKCVQHAPGTYEKHASVVYWCPGCLERHSIRLRAEGIPRPSWEWNGSVDVPTFSPSVHYVGRCHHFVKDGYIDFLPDCSHALAGRLVAMVDVDADGFVLGAS